MWFERPTRAFASVFEAARALADQPDVVLCFTAGGRRAWVSCQALGVSRSLDPEPELSSQVRELAEIPRWFGLLPYEARRDLERTRASDQRAEPLLSAPLWRRYGAWVEVTAGRVIGDDEGSVRELAALVERDLPRAPASLELSEAIEPAELHATRVRRALELIAKGEIYEVNLARRLRFRARGKPWDLLALLGERGLPPYACALEWPELAVVATSPELFLAQSADGQVWTSPIKGTRPRHPEPEQDLRWPKSWTKIPKKSLN